MRQRGDEFDRIVAWALANLPAIVQDYGGVELSRSGRAPCPIHGGTNPNLSVTAGRGFKCHKCDAHGDGVEFVRAMRFDSLPKAEGRVAAIRELAPAAGVVLAPSGTGSRAGALPSRPPRRRPAPRIVPRVRPAPPVAPSAVDPLRADGLVPQERSRIYDAILDATTLGPRGSAYLTGRGFIARDVEAYGFRSLEDAADCQRVAGVLTDSFLPEELADAGLWDVEHARVRFPFAPHQWAHGALVMPYLSTAGVLATLRFRNIAPDAPHKARYRSLHGDMPCPFNWGALPLVGDGGELHVTEGELNALSLMVHGVHAIGLPGASSWRDEWARALKPVGRLVVWFDADKGGSTGVRRLASALQAELGSSWLSTHTAPPQIVADDANTLHQRGVLGDYLARIPR